MVRKAVGAAIVVGALALAGCGGSKPTVCHVTPSGDSPPGCEQHPKGEILDIEAGGSAAPSASTDASRPDRRTVPHARQPGAAAA